MSHGGGGGVSQIRGGRFSGLNAKPDTEGQQYLTISFTSQGFQIYFGLDAMIIEYRNPSKEHIRRYGHTAGHPWNNGPTHTTIFS
jgi:hypothetical protein